MSSRPDQAKVVRPCSETKIQAKGLGYSSVGRVHARGLGSVLSNAKTTAKPPASFVLFFALEFTQKCYLHTGISY
jgi:hypothetical protein